MILQALTAYYRRLTEEGGIPPLRLPTKAYTFHYHIE